MKALNAQDEYNQTGSINSASNCVTSLWPYSYQTSTNMMKSNTITKIAAALFRAQSKMTNAVKDSSNPFFKSKYADLNAVREACLPHLQNEGIMVTQPVIQKDGKNYLRTELTHVESGEFYASDVELVCAKANDPQALGSSISYARRYGLQALVGLGAEDDDGNAGSGKFATGTTRENAKNIAEDAKAARPTFRKPTAKPATKTEESTPDGWE